MAKITAPKIDKRTFSDHLDVINSDPFVIENKQFRGLRQYFVADWKSTDAEDYGMILTRLFARLMDVIGQRINQVPQKHFIAFLNMLGIERLPGNPARVPVTFTPAPKSPRGRFVPPQTQVATTQTELTPAIIFETEEGIDLTVVQLKHVFTIEPAADRYRDLKPLLENDEIACVKILKADPDDSLVEHSLYLAHDKLFSDKTPVNIVLYFNVQSADPSFAPDGCWECYDGQHWVPMAGDANAARWLSQPGESVVTIENFTGTELYTVGGTTAHWIRCRMGGAVTVEPSLLPSIDTIRVRTQALHDAPPLPRKAFFNASPIDLNASFYPFGQKPAINNIFYMAKEEAFSISDPSLSKRITIHISLTPLPGRPPGEEFPDASRNPELAWEYFHAQTNAWSVITIPAENDTTNNFIQAGVITFDLPDQIGVVTVNGEDAHWVRARIISGDYGEEARFDVKLSGGEITDFNNIPATFRPPFISITDFRVSYTLGDGTERLPLTGCKSINQFKVLDHLQENDATGQPFAPIVPLSLQNKIDPSVYFGYSDGFGNFRISQLFEMVPQIELEGSGTGRSSKPQIVWEYYNTSGQWKGLDVEDGTRNLANTGTLAFTAPLDMAASMEFGENAYWVRARLDAGTLTKARELKSVHMNTVWAKSIRSIENELLGSGNGEPGQTIQLSQNPILLGERILVREFNVPSDEAVAQLEAAEAEYARKLEAETQAVVVPKKNPLTGDEEIWVRWYPVSNFLFSSSTDRHYVIDRVTGMITFAGDGGMPVPIAKDNIKAERYQANGGARAAGMGTPGRVKELKSALPFVAKVNSVLFPAGASKAETLRDVESRGPNTLKHRNRAVTAEGFDALAREASTSIALVRTLPVTNSAGAKELGAVTVLIVPYSTERQPMPSPELIDQVQSYLRRRASETVSHRICVIGPSYVDEICVAADIVPVNPDEASEVTGRVAQALENFFHPLTGGKNGRGWPFGRNLYISEVYSAIESIAGVDYVINAQFLPPHDSAEVEVGPNQLVYSGNHRITAVAGGPTNPG